MTEKSPGTDWNAGIEARTGDSLSLWSGGDEYLCTIVWGHLEAETAKRIAWMDAVTEWGLDEVEEYDWTKSSVVHLYGALQEAHGGDLHWRESGEEQEGWLPCTKVEPE